MSRAKAQDNSTDVSLFPFLAVLICTMGSLLVVLVGVTKLSHKEAAEKAAQQPATVGAGIDAAKTERELAEVHKYAEYLKQVRSDAEAALRDDQKRLSHIEDHIRRLGQQWVALKHAANELAALADVHSHDREKAVKEVSRLQQLIAETKENIELLKADESLKRRSYAVVPYVGNNGTQRRPLYIECRKQKVILQPEGIELTPDDFLPPLGPGNPLASALRAAREHISREEPNAAGEATAYPLILVRPDGIAAYYRVRDAIESWDADFGYELIDGDWDLEFPPANPQLAEVENRAVKLARARERMLAEAAPRAYEFARSARGTGFHSGAGGEDSLGGGYGSSDGYGADGEGSGNGTGSGEQDGDAFLSGDDGNGQKSGDGMILGQSGGDARYDEGGPGQGEGGEGGKEPGDTQGPVLGGPEGDRYAQGDEAGSPAEEGGERELYAGVPSGGSSSDVGGQSPTPGGGTSATSSGSGMSSASPSGQSSIASGSVGSVGHLSTPGSTTSTSVKSLASHDPQARPGNSSFQGDPEGQPNPLAFERSFDRDSQQSAAVANIRGKDWAVANTEGVPIRRSVQVVVREDHVAILPERTRSGEVVVGGKEIPFKGSTAASLDTFVKALQDHMVDWGMAGQGLYWRPVLVLNVGPDGQKRADDLAQLLRNSGMELRRASDTAMLEEGSESNATR